MGDSEPLRGITVRFNVTIVVLYFYYTYSNPLKYTSLRAAEKVVHFKFVYIEIAYT